MPILRQPNGTASITGALEIYDAERDRQALLELLSAKQELILDLSQLKTCDAAGAQLLWAARASALKAGKSIRFENIPQPIAESWDKLGLRENYLTHSD